MALTQLSPYQVGGGVNREIMFFGHRELIARIMNRDPSNYLLESALYSHQAQYVVTNIYITEF